MRRLCLLLSIVSIIGLGRASAGWAAVRPHVIVWSGALAPGTPATGVELDADGSGRRLSADGAGTIRVDGSFRPGAKDLAQIRAAAEDLLLHGPDAAHANVEDGGYVTVQIQDGAARATVTDTGKDSAAVASLLAPINRVLAPRGGRVEAAGSKSKAPSTAPCPQGQSATDISKELSLDQASKAKLVTTKPKGALGGDSIAVDATWKDVVAPARIVMHIEVQAQGGGPVDDYVAAVKTELQRSYQGYAVDGQPVNFEFDVVGRAPGSPPRPCYHEILMHPADDIRSYVNDVGPSPQGGEWSMADRPYWAHEAAHLLGLPDEYDDYFHSDEKNIDFILPANGLDAQQLQEFLAPLGLNPSLGHVYPKPHSLYEHDLLAVGRNARLNPYDIGRLIAQAPLAIVDQPGDILVSKDPSRQNFVTGAPFRLLVPRGQHVHVDGMVAYCIDIHKDVPQLGGAAYDVVGPASSIGGEGMDALQRVVDVVAAREPGPLQETQGANDAIWRVTDDAEVLNGPDDAAARSILEAAGVPVDVAAKTYAAPHFDDPASGIDETVALERGGPAPEPAPPVQGAEPAAVPPRLVALRAAPGRLRAPRRGRPLMIIARVTLAGARDQVALRLTRGGRTVARSRPVSVAVGRGALALVVRRLRPGSYRLVAAGAHGGQVATRLTVRG